VRFLLDTDVFSAIARQTSVAAELRLGTLEAGSTALSVVTSAEIAFGLERRPVSSRLTLRIQRLQQVLPVLPLPIEAAKPYARIKTHLERLGTPIGPNDLWLAAHALCEDLTLVTNNEREFRRIPGLKMENWLR
jgi:tRNA(fMet)-specific endonuclease VapC